MYDCWHNWQVSIASTARTWPSRAIISPITPVGVCISSRVVVSRFFVSDICEAIHGRLLYVNNTHVARTGPAVYHTYLQLRIHTYPSTRSLMHELFAQLLSISGSFFVDNLVQDNTCNFCNRANLGDSAGILLACSSTHNIISHNIARYGGDGIYLAW